MSIRNLSSFLEKKSIRADALDDNDLLEVLGVSNKVGITITDHKKSKDLSKYQLVEEGDFAYNPYRINVGSIGLVPSGVRGFVSPVYVVFKTNKNLLPELLFDFLKSNEGLFQIGKYARGTVRKTLRFEDLCQIEMSVPTLNKQKFILKKKESVEIEVNELKTELTHQQSLLKKLRQQILQEAIEGKLTADWREQNRDVEPASELLARIQAEKAQLIKDKKIKNQKPLPPISEEEKPFALPDGWVWCRLGEISNYGETKRIGPLKINNDTWVLELEDIEKETSNLLKKVTFKDRNSKSTQSIFSKGDVLYGKLRPYLDKVLVADNDGVCTTEIMPIKTWICPYYLRFSLKTKKFIEYTNKVISGMRMPRLKTDDARIAIIPLPPLPEQKVIATKVEKLLALCDQLETQITDNQIHAEQLMQAVLKEAFAQSKNTPAQAVANA